MTTAKERRADRAPSMTPSGAAQLLEIGVLSSLGSVVSILPVFADAGRDPLGLRGALAMVWLAGMGLSVIAFGAARLRAREKIRIVSSPGRVAIVITIGVAAAGLAVGVMRVLEPHVPGQTLNPTAAGHVAVAASLLALALASLAFAGRARMTSWRLATQVAAAASMVLLLDGANVLHMRSPGVPLLTVSATAAIIGVVVITYVSTRQRPIEARVTDPAKPET